MTSHSLDEIESLCDKICFMQKGELKAVGTKSQLKKKLGHELSVVLEVEQCYEHFVAVELLSHLANIPISPILTEALQAHVDAALLQKKQADDAIVAARDEVTAKIMTDDKDVPDFRKNELYVAFAAECKERGVRVAEQRTRHVEINVKKEKFTLQQIFAEFVKLKQQLYNIILTK